VANPFSGTITGKNTGHTNQANLVYAMIPRSTTVIKEIITDTNATLSGAAVGSYDADGYIFGSTAASNSTAVLTGLSLNVQNAITIIAGIYYTGTNGDGVPTIGMDDAGASTRYIRFRQDGYQRRGYAETSEGSLIFQSGYTSYGNNHIGLASRTTAGAQAAKYIDGTTSPPSGTLTTYTTGTDTKTFGSGGLDRIVFQFTATWGLQYLLVYNASLSDADIETIIENPGNVLSYEAGSSGIPKSTKFFLMGIG
jgi:hypothetical protein